MSEEEKVEEPPSVGLTFQTEEGPNELKYDDYYKTLEYLAEGAFGKVNVAEHIESKLEYAVKVIDRAKLNEKTTAGVMLEVSTMKLCRDVSGIVRLVDYYVTPEAFYLIQDYAKGGDVFGALVRRTAYTEADARDLACCLLQAIAFLKERKIAHRDLKPENLLLRTRLSASDILLADFGFAKPVPVEGLKTRCGTPSYVAPEIVDMDTNRRYDESVDCWSVGCLLYMLLGGYPPFEAKNHRFLFRKIRGADFCFHDKYWSEVSIPGKRLIAGLLTVNPKHRLTAKDALKSEWLLMAAAKLQQHNLSKSLDAMREFRARSTFKGAILAVVLGLRTNFKADSFAEQMKEWDVADSKKPVPPGEDPHLTKNRPGLKFAEVYEMGDTIYENMECKIKKCHHRHQNKDFAVKVIERDPKGAKHRKYTTEQIHHEQAVLNAMQHEYIIDNVDFFDGGDKYYIVMELMQGGDLFDRICQMESYTEKDARDFAKILLEAMAYVHGNGICHRDIKPQNILLKTGDITAAIKLADFSFACRVHTPQSLTKRCGTPHYVSPEILKNIPYDQSADMWSVGIIIYLLLCGYTPFADEDQSVLLAKIRSADYEFDPEYWKNISDDAKELIRNLLTVDPLGRWTAEDALKCHWFDTEAEKLSARDLSETREKIEETKRVKLKTVAKTIMQMQSVKMLQGLSLRDLGKTSDPSAPGRRASSVDVEQLPTATEGDSDSESD
jgi:serine/threonine protein kinase